MLKNLSIRNKLLAGFGIILVLMTAISSLAFYKISDLAFLFSKKDNFAEITILMNKARENRNNYFHTSDNKYRDEVNAAFDRIQELYDTAFKSYTSVEDTQNISKMMDVIKTYSEAFRQYATGIEKKSELVNNLNKTGALLFQHVDKIESKTFAVDLLMMRIDAVKYLAKPTKELYDSQQEFYNRANNYARQNLTSDTELINALTNYNEVFNQVALAFDDIDKYSAKLVQGGLDAQEVCGAVIKSEMEALSSSILSTKIFILVISLTAVLTGIFISMLISRAITLPMHKAVETANTMAKGDFTKSLDIDQKDEIGQFAKALESMRNSLKGVIEGLVQSSNSLASASTELASTTEELAATFSDQASQVSMVASAVEEISTSSSEVLASINDVKTKSDSAKKLTNEGQTCIKTANTVMNSIQQNVEGLGTTVAELARSSEEIGNILLVINDIADQTNLLALNAAIEAARAGDHGRGFAVVADEVRKLAERTQTSIHEIESIISTFVRETTKTNQEMNSAKSKVNDGVNKLNETDSIFEKIVTAVDEISTSSSVINTAITEQVSAINNINDNAHVISSGLEQSSAAIEQVSSTVADIQHQADDQMESASQFKI
ncbi:MAG: methyl-accepting chemotaxis protein [Deferribacterales bacterium]